MAGPVLLGRVHLAERQGAAARHEDRVVAEAAIAPRRPDKAAVNLTAKQLDIAVRPGKGENRDERGARVSAAELAVDPLHRHPEILVGTGPAGGMNPGRAAEPRDGEAGIVSKRGQPG